MPSCSLSFTDRARVCQAMLAKQLCQLIDSKKTNLALSADVTSAQQLIELAALLGPEICVLKTHIDIIEDYTPALTQMLQKLAKQHQFLLFEDRKFADIGHTVKHQYERGIYRIADWADIINAHALPGPGIVQGLAETGYKKERGLLLIAEMSSAGHLLTNDYQRQTLKIAEQFPQFVIGFITQHALNQNPQWLNFTPGINFEKSGDGLAQQYVTPDTAIIEQGADIIIVGRGIVGAKDPLAKAREYRQLAWDAYLQRSSYSSSR